MASLAQPTSASPRKSHPLLLYLCAYLFVLYILYTRLNLYLTRRRMKLDNNCQPCPHRLNKDPILGLDILRQNLNNAANKKILEATYNRFIRFSSYTIQSRIMSMPLIMTIEPENVKTILSTKFKDYSFGARNKAFGPLLGTGIFNSDGERWANSRHLLRPNFVREQVADLAMLERHYRIMRKWIPAAGKTVDVQDLFFKLTIDTATEFLFAHSTNSLKMMPGLDGKEMENEDTVFAKAFTFAQEDVVTRTRLGFLDRFRKNKEGKEAIRICHEYVDKWVADAVRIREQLDSEKGEKGQEERYVFIQELAKQTKDKKRIRDEVMNILLAGRDTTASLLSNMFFEIAKRPEIWRKLREEVGMLGGRAPTYEELRGLKYLKWCLNESLRLHPVVPGNSRYAIRDTILPLGGGPSGTSPLFIPRGTLIGYSVYSMHRRTDYFGPDALVFRPERWETLRPGWEYLPFNGGPRICLGQQYALTEASYVTCRLVQEFGGLESRSETGVWREGLTLTCCSGDGVKVGFMEG